MEKENYGVVILITRFYSLNEKLIKANEEMLDHPNEHSNNAYVSTKRLMHELKQCLKALDIEVN